MRKEYSDAEIKKGPCVSAHINGHEISLYVQPNVGIPVCGTPWEKNGWELMSLKSPTVSS